MHTGSSQAECAVGERHSADMDICEQFVAGLLAAPVGSGLPVGAINRVIQRWLFPPDEEQRAARVVTREGAGPVRPQ